MRLSGYSMASNPMYALGTGSAGVFITFAMFLYRYPDPLDGVGQTFVSRPEYLVWVFLHAVLSCILAISLYPMWKILVSFSRDQARNENASGKRKIVTGLIVNAIIWTILIFALLGFLTSVYNSFFDPSAYLPHGHNARVTFIYMFTFLVVLPALMGIMSIHTATQKLSARIAIPDQTKAGLFAFRDELLTYRSLLQGYLFMLGVILSMVTITTAGSRAIFVGLEAQGIDNFPVTHAILFGLVFTVLLLLVYVPVHFALTDTSRKLRDSLCPISSIETLRDDMAQRKQLDEMLQTNVSIMDNLKYGFITLAPFVSSLLASVIGIEIAP